LQQLTNSKTNHFFGKKTPESGIIWPNARITQLALKKIKKNTDKNLSNPDNSS